MIDFVQFLEDVGAPLLVCSFEADIKRARNKGVVRESGEYGASVKVKQASKGRVPLPSASEHFLAEVIAVVSANLVPLRQQVVQVCTVSTAVIVNRN